MKIFGDVEAHAVLLAPFVKADHAEFVVAIIAIRINRPQLHGAICTLRITINFGVLTGGISGGEGSGNISFRPVGEEVSIFV